ncbi:tail fiber domain-containing protein [Bacillus pretiosus]|uniref:tail fiber domain-containing protein n=1 Tax=Bacillus pretiosus TaxID=2983392 RepID=UPI003D6535D6
MARYIRYLENGTWKYASVKSVGELEKLLTKSKTDIVSAINELIANGGALEHDLNTRFDGLEGQQNELVTITGNVQETLSQVQGDLLNKAEALYVDEQIKKLVNKEDYDANYQKIEGELLDKVNIEKYNEEYKLVTAKLNDKTDLSAFEGVEGRVTTTEQEITNVKGELGSKIGKTEFDSAVGLNRWLARKYDINIGSAGAIPSFSHIKGKQPSEVVDYDDNSMLKPFTGDYYVGHYFTNVYMKVAKTVNLTVTHDDGAVIYMNGAKMYEGKTRTTGLTVAMTFRAGWNTVEILHYEHSGATEYVSLGLKLSTQVDKLTSVIGIGDKDDTRLVEAETQIKQNAEAILLKAEGSEVTSLGNKVTAHEASINLMKDEITMLVKTEDFNKYTGRLETAESTITQHSNQISQKVEKKDYDALNNIVGQQQTSINQLTSEISLMATKSDYDGLNGRVGNAETQINLNTEAIKLKAEKTELDKTNGRLSTAEAQLTVQAGEIASKVTQEDIDESLSPIESRVGNAESTIVQHTTAIGLKANANEVYKKAEADGKISTAVTQAKGEIKLETDKIALNVTNLTKTVTEQGTTISNHETSITQMKGAINLKAEANNVYTKTEADNKTSTAISTAKAEIEVTTKGITQTVTNVQNDLKGVKDTVTAQGTQIKQTSDEVAINVVKKGNIMASLNASTEGIKILGKHLDITSLVTFQSLDSAMQSKVNAGTSAEQNAKNYTNLIASNESSYINKNYNFADWTGSLPNGFVGAVGATPTKVASENGNGNSVKFTTTAGQAGYFNIFSKTKPFYQYVYVETTFKLESGSINGAGILFRYLKADGTSILYDNGFKFKDLVPSPVLNKWYTVSLVLKVNPSTDFGGYSIFPMASWSTFDSTMPANVIHFDSVITRPATEQEINSYESRIAIADMSNDNKATPIEKNQLKKEWATIVAEKLQYEALATTYGITTEKTNYVNAYNALNTAVSPIIANTTVTSDINGATFRNTFDDYYDKLAQLIKKINELSRSIGTNADTKAQEAKNSIADMANDNKITPIEKQQLKKEWASISAEKPQYESLATTYGVGTEKTNYVNAYNALNTFITPFLANTTVTSDINGATFRATFDDYYDKKAQLVKKINELSKVVAQGLNGKVLHNDPMFKNGLNDIKVYNNSGNTNVTITRVAKPSDAPTNSTHVLEIKALALPISPAYGGFSFQTASRANAIFVTRIVAKIPVGSKLVFASNSTGTGGKTEWLTPVTGTGNWEEYLCRVQCGSTGTFSSTNFFNIEGGTLPLTWYVAYATVIDATDYDYSITDMANDNKLTPLEKQQLKKEWATISAEKPQYEALSNTYGVTTEKTNYVNAYNALNTFITPLISNIAVTSDVTGSTFRATFDDYYDKKAQLIKKINELARSIGTNADSKAQEAKNAIADMSSDSKITPVEKVQLAKEWAVMLSEKPQYEALATTYGITTEKTNYVNAYNTLNTVLNGTGGILTNMTTTSAVTGTTFRGQFDDYYDKKSQLVKKINETAKSLADGAQGTANTANNTANTANTAINNNKAIWDRASNINSNGTFNSSKLSGLILDAQISSAVNWNGAKSLLDSWKSGTTLINGGMIATNTIFAQQIAIGDFTNLSQINEEKNPNGYPTALLNSKRYFKIGNGAYASLVIVANTYVEFKVNDEYYIAFNGYRDAGLTTLNAVFRYYYSDGTWENAGSVSVLPTTADTRVARNLKITTPPNDTKTLTAVNLFFEKDGTAGSGYYYIRDIEIRKRYTGELIVDGSIKAQQLDVNSLFAHSGFITNLKSQEIDASKIKTGQLIGIYIRSDGTNAFSYMSGGSIVSKSKVSSVETWVDEGLVRVKSSTSMLSLSEDNLSIGQIGKSGYGSITYTAPNTDPAQNLFSIWGVGKVILESNQSDIILKGRAYIQGVDSEGISLNFPEANSIRFDRYGNINAPSSMTSGATWSVKDGNGRVKLLIGVGKDSTITSEYNAYGGGHAFNHNGERIFAIWKQGDANYVQQFAGQGILKWQKSQGRFEFRNGDDTNWSRVAGIVENASSRDYKKNISHFDGSALDIINASNARLYHYNNQDDSEKLNIGLIAEEAPQLVQGKDGKSVDGYGMTTLAWKAIQELSEQVRYLNEKINNR